MRKFIILFIIISAGELTSQIDSLGCTGALGDVKYSILSPDDFQSVNGECWVLMDGRNISSTKLGALGFSQLPDARGIFIRGYDNRMDDDTERKDIDRSFGDPIGTYQEDIFKNHEHQITPLVAGTAGGGGARRIRPPWDVGDNGGNTITGQLTTTAVGGSETRPKNISMYTYIRIN